jgi:hypothetical protein
MTIRSVLFAAIFACTFQVVAGQTDQVETPAICNDEYARFLVDQQVSESRSVSETDKRVKILVRVADFLWKFDEPVAREYLAEAFKVANDRFNEKGFEKIENKGMTTVMPDHRFEVIRAIAAKDSEWAKRLIEQVLKDLETAAKREEFDKTRELQDIIRIAQESAATNPALSRALFQRAMDHPLDFHWYWLPFSLAEKNQALADSIYSELLVRYANASPRALLFLSAYPFASARVLGPEKYQFGTSVPGTLKPNPALQRRFLGTFIRRAVTYASDPQNLHAPAEQYRLPEPLYLISALTEIEPIVLQNFPDMMQSVGEAKAQVNGMITEQMRSKLEEREKSNEALGYGFERRLKEVEEAESKGKLTDAMVVGLITWSANDRTEEQFKQLEPWLDKIRDENGRLEATNYFWFLRSRLAIKENRMDDADRYAKKIPEIEHRAILIFEIAEKQLKNVNDASTAYSTLREVGRLAEQAETSVEKARVLLGLVNQYMRFNQVFAVQELSDAVRVINRIETGNILSTTVTRQVRVKDFSFFANFGMPAYSLENTFKEISKKNFELSLTNAKGLEDKYLRTLAVLAVAQNCVDKVKKTPPARKPAARPKN